MNYERPYYEDINYHPLMFYVVFGAKEEELEISRERHNIDEIPEGLNINMLIREQHGEYMDNLIGGTLGKILKEEQPELYEKIQKENIWAVINGEIMQDDNLKYLRNTIGIVQAFLDTGAIAVLDMQTFSLYSAEEFTEKIFSKDLDVYSHVKNLISKMEDKNIWLHTRGLRKFERPDVSIENIDESEVDKAVKVANQMIFYSAQGMLFNKKVKLHPYKDEEEAIIINPEFIEDYENIDFNNAYCKLLWEECEQVIQNK